MSKMNRVMDVVDDQDYMLVVKALQLQQERSSEIILCADHEEDSPQFEVIEANIKQSEITPTIKYSDIVNFVGKEVEELKKMLENYPVTNALVWCGHLVVNFHSEKDCKNCVSSAIKFLLNAFRETGPSYKDETLLKLACTHRVNKNLFLDCFKVYWRFSPSLTGNFLQEMFEIIDEAKIDLLTYWKIEEDGFFLLFHQLYFTHSYVNIEDFITFIKFGRTGYILRRVVELDGCEVTLRSLDVLALQVFMLYKNIEKKKENRFLWARYSYALRLLWNSFTEPFLVKEEFHLIFKIVPCVLDMLNEIWAWYEESVLKKESSVKGPRSLRHLSRCSVRFAMVKSFQFPRGVQSLPVPTEVKDYILFADC